MGLNKKHTIKIVVGGLLNGNFPTKSQGYKTLAVNTDGSCRILGRKGNVHFVANLPYKN